MKATVISHLNINDFIESAKSKVLIAGYGSLLSQYSRQTYSQIMGPSIPVMVKGWERNWITRSISEEQTYAGAIPNRTSQLSAQLIPLQFNDSFEKREQDYRFTKILPQSVHLQGIDTLQNKALQQLLIKTPIYICETLAIEPSTPEYPVSLSYVETCLAGSYESRREKGIKAFLKSTNGWENTQFYDDRENHRYPRSSLVMPEQRNEWGELYLRMFSALTRNITFE
ncbi:MAG: hypothetical protein ACJAVV_001530 [Alphaproteobacteria bacterium]|jgi:hypothetical protein